MAFGHGFEVTVSVRYGRGGYEITGIRSTAAWRTNIEDPEAYELVVIVPGRTEAIGLIRAPNLFTRPSFVGPNDGHTYRLDKASVERALVEMDLFLEHL